MKITPKDEVFKVIMSTVNKLVDLVKPTFGPSGNKVIIGKGLGVSALDDGVQIAKDLELEDEAENYILKMIREVAVKTNDRVGDGTTSSLIILQAIMKEIEKIEVKDGRKIVAELKKGLGEAVEQLKKQGIEIKTKQDLEKVALVSFDNQEVAKLLADIVYKIGVDGLIDVEPSQSLNIESEMTKGFTINSGYVSPYMITEKEECVLENPYILVTDSSFVNGSEIIPLMEKVLDSNGNSLLVLCKGFEGEALSIAVLNKLNGKFKTLAVKIYEDYEDIALLTGATSVMTEKGKLSIDNVNLGRAKKVVSKRDSTIIIGGKGDKALIEEKVKELRSEIDSTSDEKTKVSLRNRLARLTNSSAVIKVGAVTENEAKALRYKIEDASNAVKVAYKKGVVAGAGKALASLETSSPILNSALKYPRKQLEENLGVLGETDNVIDPLEVLIAGIESAVSIASLLVTTSGIITEEKPK